MPLAPRIKTPTPRISTILPNSVTIGEIGVQSGEREPGAVNGWFANFAVKSHARAFKCHVELFGVTVVKPFDRDNRNAFLLIACGCNRLGPASFRHQD